MFYGYIDLKFDSRLRNNTSYLEILDSDSNLYLLYLTH